MDFTLSWSHLLHALSTKFDQYSRSDFQNICSFIRNSVFWQHCFAVNLPHLLFMFSKKRENAVGISLRIQKQEKFRVSASKCVPGKSERVFERALWRRFVVSISWKLPTYVPRRKRTALARRISSKNWKKTKWVQPFQTRMDGSNRQKVNKIFQQGGGIFWVTQKDLWTKRKSRTFRQNQIKEQSI